MKSNIRGLLAIDPEVRATIFFCVPATVVAALHISVVGWESEYYESSQLVRCVEHHPLMVDRCREERKVFLGSES